MTVGLVAFHYPEPKLFDEFIARAQQAVEAIRVTPGCLSADCWVTNDGDAVVTTGQWESEDTYKASFVTAREAGVDFTYDERECRPRQVFTLHSR
ncbi:antibiotic biosynthesis monooxygenase [Nonomuraea sp. NPDC000554]|uniref:antibiotic biosynthesis monooxygenase n=1 Tax=Nonomuraea sp. NPDC000554 TaxID=3154259 RepID=UPI00332670B0